MDRLIFKISSDKFYFLSCDPEHCANKRRIKYEVIWKSILTSQVGTIAVTESTLKQYKITVLFYFCLARSGFFKSSRIGLECFSYHTFKRCIPEFTT